MAAEIALAVYMAIGFGMFLLALAIDGKVEGGRAFTGPGWQDLAVALCIIFGWLPAYLIWTARRIFRRR